MKIHYIEELFLRMHGAININPFLYFPPTSLERKSKSDLQILICTMLLEAFRFVSQHGEFYYVLGTQSH